MKFKLGVGAFRPEYAHKEDAGIDLRSPIAVTIEPHKGVIIDTRVAVGIPEGYCGLIVSKSGLNVNHGITSTGLIDEGYTGSIKVKLYNHSGTTYVIHEGDKITQLVILPVHHATLEEVDSLYSPALRGNAGFGSTGR